MTDDDYERIEQRGERLRVLISAIGEEPSMDPGECSRDGLVPGQRPLGDRSPGSRRRRRVSIGGRS